MGKKKPASPSLREALLPRLVGLAILALFLAPWFRVDAGETSGARLLDGSAHEALSGLRKNFANASDFAAWSELSRLLFYRRTALALATVAASGFALVLAPRRHHPTALALGAGGMSGLLAYWVAAYFAHDVWSLDGDTDRSIAILFALDALASVPLALGVLAGAGVAFERPWGPPLARAFAILLFLALVVPDHRGVVWAARAEALLLGWAWARFSPRDAAAADP